MFLAFKCSEELKECPEKITTLLAQKKHLEATQALVRSLDRLHGSLKEVDGLKEVKEVLENQKESLYNTLLEDLSKQLYTESTWEVLQLKRTGSFKDNNPFQRSSFNSNRGSGSNSKTGSGKEKRTGSGRKPGETGSASGGARKTGDHIRARRLLIENAQDNSAKILTLAQEDEFNRILDNPKLASLTEGPAHVIVIDIECLAMLNQLPKVLEALKSELLNELQSIVLRSTQMLMDSGQFPQGDPRLLPDLFTAVVDQFHLVVDAYRLLGRAIVKSVDR